jgi:hypothetical protein
MTRCLKVLQVIAEHPLGRFDMSKIGTGEGAQAYGRGLYFAQAEGVGKGYRDQLSEGLGTVDGESIGGWAAEILDNSKGDPSALRARINMAPDDFWVMNFEEGIAAKDNLLGVVDRLESGVSTWRPGGAMYEVNIDVEPDELIEWDELIDEQPSKVLDKLEKSDWWEYAEEGIYDRAGARGDNPTGADLIRWLEEDGAEDAAEALKDFRHQRHPIR